MPRRTPSALRVAAWTVAVLFVLVPVLYVLSYGPAVRLLLQGRLSGGLFNAMYVPLERVTATHPVLERMRYKYIVGWTKGVVEPLDEGPEP